MEWFKVYKLKRKLIGIFDPDTAYELLSSCCFIGVVGGQYQIKLLKNIPLSKNLHDKILQQIQVTYGSNVRQLQIISFAELKDNQDNTADEKQGYLLQLSKQLNTDSVWYKVRKFLIERYNKYIDFGVLSKLVVVRGINKKIILKSISARCCSFN
ncbi:hypothetical protein [Rickettsia parkeri]|uniref:hypothetical protein n=1 Tax=Rickettsia parkeri TaxID=35792 RepID=UPI0016498502|nr:hypothetical protein [Rickettsia parkeri]